MPRHLPAYLPTALLGAALIMVFATMPLPGPAPTIAMIAAPVLA